MLSGNTDQTKLRNFQPYKYRYLSMLPAATDISLLSQRLLTYNIYYRLCSTVEWHYNEGPLIETGKIHVFTIQAPWQQKFCILRLNVENSCQVDDHRTLCNSKRLLKTSQQSIYSYSAMIVSRRVVFVCTDPLGLSISTSKFSRQISIHFLKEFVMLGEN